MATLFPERPILLVDDEPAFLQSLSLTLKRLGGLTNLVQCRDSRQVASLLEQQDFCLAIFDMMMPYIPGEKLLEQTGNSHPELPVIILTGMNQVELAVNCIKTGAFDYFVKTGEAERLVAGIKRALRQTELQQECARLKRSVFAGSVENPAVFSEIITVDKQMHALFGYVEAVAKSREPVMITGESGVGKEQIARSVHRLSRPDGPWVAVNVAGLDDNVFFDTLFGHVKGAFTGAETVRRGLIDQAQNGTLFLDEIGDLTLESQIKLLRLLQEGEYHPLGSDRSKCSNARIVVATNQDLQQRQKEGKFRKDLYYRLRAHHVEIPPLRERKEDLPLLLEHFLEEAAASLQKKKPTPPPELTTLLALYEFPGNVRELRAMVFDAVSLHKSKKLSMSSFEAAMGLDAKKLSGSFSNEGSAQVFNTQDQLPTLKEAAELLVREAMRRTDGNQSMAAKLLGITQPSLSSRLKKIALRNSKGVGFK